MNDRQHFVERIQDEPILRDDVPHGTRRSFAHHPDTEQASRELKLRSLARMELHTFPRHSLPLAEFHLHPGRLVEAVDRPDSGHLPASGIWVRRIGTEPTPEETAAALREVHEYRNKRWGDLTHDERVIRDEVRAARDDGYRPTVSDRIARLECPHSCACWPERDALAKRRYEARYAPDCGF